MVETSEGALHPPDKRTDRFQQGVRPPPEGGERQALEVAKQTHPVPAPAEVPPPRQRAGGGRYGLGEAQRRVAFAGPRDKSLLQREPFGPLGRATDLEHEPLAGIAFEQEVGIALAGKRSGVPLQSPQFARDGCRLMGADPRPVPQGVDGEGELPSLPGGHQRSSSLRSPSLPR